MAVKVHSVQTQPKTMFKPEVGYRVSKSGKYGFDVCKARYNEESGVLVLTGKPSRTNKLGKAVVYDRIPICVSNKFYESAEVNPIIDLFDTCGLDIDTSVSPDVFVGRHLEVEIEISETEDGGRYYNAAGFYDASTEDNDDVE